MDQRVTRGHPRGLPREHLNITVLFSPLPIVSAQIARERSLGGPGVHEPVPHPRNLQVRSPVESWHFAESSQILQERNDAVRQLQMQRWPAEPRASRVSISQQLP
jgi:hypothetical protein